MALTSLKIRKLEDIVRSCDSAAVAFSGGVDSSVLAAVARKVLGRKAVAVTLDSPAMPRSELAEARKLARWIGIRHVVFKHDELKDRNFVKNTIRRCYYCKRLLAQRLRQFALNHNLSCVLEGTNASEVRGHRPGFRALRQAGVKSPLAIAGFTKKDVRSLARAFKLPVQDKPSMACLSSRIPYGTLVTARDLRRVELAEACLKKQGFSQVRVRCYGRLAVIETMPEEFHIVFDNGTRIAKAFRRLGFSRTTLDLQGYRTGSMNQEALIKITPAALHTLRNRPSRTRRRDSR